MSYTPLPAACEGSEYWRCLEPSCGMTAVTRAGLVTLLGGVPARGHTHPPASPHQQLAQTLSDNLLRRVRSVTVWGRRLPSYRIFLVGFVARIRFGCQKLLNIISNCMCEDSGTRTVSVE